MVGVHDDPFVGHGVVGSLFGRRRHFPHGHGQHPDGAVRGEFRQNQVLPRKPPDGQRLATANLAIVVLKRSTHHGQVADFHVQFRSE